MQGDLFAEILTHLVQHHTNAHLQAYLTQGQMGLEKVRLQRHLLVLLQGTYQAASTKSNLEIRAKQESLAASLAQFGESLRDETDRARQETEAIRSSWQSDLRDWQTTREEAWKVRKGRLLMQMALFKGKTDQFKTQRALFVVLSAITAGAIYCVGKVREMNKHASR